MTFTISKKKPKTLQKYEEKQKKNKKNPNSKSSKNSNQKKKKKKRNPTMIKVQEKCHHCPSVSWRPSNSVSVLHVVIHGPTNLPAYFRALDSQPISQPTSKAIFQPTPKATFQPTPGVT